MFGIRVQILTEQNLDISNCMINPKFSLINFGQGGGMDKYKCLVCGYIYDPAKGDPDNGVKPGTSFEALPADWVCPECGVGKDMFEKI